MLGFKRIKKNIKKSTARKKLRKNKSTFLKMTNKKSYRQNKNKKFAAFRVKLPSRLSDQKPNSWVKYDVTEASPSGPAAAS